MLVSKIVSIDLVVTKIAWHLEYTLHVGQTARKQYYRQQSKFYEFEPKIVWKIKSRSKIGEFCLWWWPKWRDWSAETSVLDKNDRLYRAKYGLPTWAGVFGQPELATLAKFDPIYRRIWSNRIASRKQSKNKADDGANKSQNTFSLCCSRASSSHFSWISAFFIETFLSLFHFDCAILLFCLTFFFGSNR